MVEIAKKVNKMKNRVINFDGKVQPKEKIEGAEKLKF